VVQNGGFETGDFTDWTLVGNGRPYNLVDMVLLGNLASFRRLFCALGQYGSIAYLSETLPTLSGQAYLLSLWMDSPDGKTLNEFNVSWNGNTLVDLVNMPKLGWTNLQFIVTASGSSTVLQIGARNDPTYLALDDVSVTTVPVPAFQTLTKNEWHAQLHLERPDRACVSNAIQRPICSKPTGSIWVPSSPPTQFYSDLNQFHWTPTRNDFIVSSCCTEIPMLLPHRANAVAWARDRFAPTH